jgi:hypothetical protein
MTIFGLCPNDGAAEQNPTITAAIAAAAIVCVPSRIAV